MIPRIMCACVRSCQFLPWRRRSHQGGNPRNSCGWSHAPRTQSQTRSECTTHGREFCAIRFWHAMTTHSCAPRPMRKRARRQRQQKRGFTSMHVYIYEHDTQPVHNMCVTVTVTSCARMQTSPLASRGRTPLGTARYPRGQAPEPRQPWRSCAGI